MRLSSSNSISTKLQWIAELSKKKPTARLTTLAHHIDLDWMYEAYFQTRKNGAVGVDGQTAKQYEQELEENLLSLLNRFKSGTYRAPAVRRVYIPKGDGKSFRPLGIPTFEDKILQRAVTMVLEAIYEQQFLNCSYGFRPGRSAHQALESTRKSLDGLGGGTIIEIDIEKFYDRLNHQKLREILDKRIGDGVIRRMIDKWLKAGIFEDGMTRQNTLGAPQGGVISPILSNIYLHEVLDQWFEQDVRPRMIGEAELVRFADDAVQIFEYESDANRVMKVLQKRFEKYGLTLHSTKTRKILFKRPPGKSESFNLLGFTHYWKKALNGSWMIQRKTAKDRFKRGLRNIQEWCRKYRSQSVEWQHQQLTSKLRGHYQYYGITGNSIALDNFRRETLCIWQKWLNRRAQRRHMKWEKFNQLLSRYPLPHAICVHSKYRRQAKL